MSKTIARRKVQRLFTGMVGSPLSGVRESPSKPERNAADYERRKESAEWKSVAKELHHRLSFYSLKDRSEILAYLEHHNTPEEAREWLAAYKEWGEGRGSYGPTGAIAATGDNRGDTSASDQLEAIDAKTQANRIDDGEDEELEDGEIPFVKIYGLGGGRRAEIEGHGPDTSQDQDYREDDPADHIEVFSSDEPEPSEHDPEPDLSGRRWYGAREGDCPQEVRARIARGKEEYRVIRLAARLVEFRKLERAFACRICGKRFDAENFEPQGGVHLHVKDFGGPARESDYSLVSEPHCGALIVAMSHVRSHPVSWTRKSVNHLLSRWVPVRDEMLARFVPDQTPPRCLFCAEPFLTRNDVVNHFLFGDLRHFRNGKVEPHFGQKTIKECMKQRMKYRADCLLSSLPVDSANQYGCVWFCCKSPTVTGYREQALKNHTDKLSDVVWLHFSDRIRGRDAESGTRVQNQRKAIGR